MSSRQVDWNVLCGGGGQRWWWWWGGERPRIRVRENSEQDGTQPSPGFGQQQQQSRKMFVHFNTCGLMGVITKCLFVSVFFHEVTKSSARKVPCANNTVIIPAEEGEELTLASPGFPPTTECFAKFTHRDDKSFHCCFGSTQKCRNAKHDSTRCGDIAAPKMDAKHTKECRLTIEDVNSDNYGNYEMFNGYSNLEHTCSINIATNSFGNGPLPILLGAIISLALNR